MKIIGVESVVYGAEDVEQATRFHVDWGLELTDKGVAGSDFKLPDDTTVHIRAIDDSSLPPASVPGSTAREVIWGVEDKATLEAIGAELSSDREVTADAAGGLHSHDNLGYRLGFRISARKPKPVGLPDTNTVWNAPRVDTRAELFSRSGVRQQRMFHVVYWAPGDTEAHANFYMERLGFQLTESVKGIGFFMRCGGSHDHHNLFLEGHPKNVGFQHVAYEVQDFDEILRCGTHMEEQGWISQIGPGRHYFGSGLFWYFRNPAGGLSETGMDSDYISDDWKPLRHETIPPEASRPWIVRREEIGKAVGAGNWPQLMDGKIIPAAAN
ncbi:MAG: VOC family protein [Proteobacteria bacterium]|nr:VOC family protein [Pseudomonadota bacterium]